MAMDVDSAVCPQLRQKLLVVDMPEPSHSSGFLHLLQACFNRRVKVSASHYDCHRRVGSEQLNRIQRELNIILGRQARNNEKIWACVESEFRDAIRAGLRQYGSPIGYECRAATVKCLPDITNR